MKTGTHADGKPTVHPESAAEWHAWLDAHHQEAQGVWLIYWKQHTGLPAVEYADSVAEALCFGWIDSRISRLDEDRAMRWFSPRRPKSPWTRANKRKIAELDAEGRLAPAAQALVEAAQRDGSWTVYDDVEDLVVPPDLAAALAADPAAEGFFARFSASAKKNVLWWIKSAKTASTREKRIAETAARAAENRVANQPAGRDAGPD